MFYILSIFSFSSGSVVITKVMVLYSTNNEDDGDPGCSCQLCQQGRLVHLNHHSAVPVSWYGIPPLLTAPSTHNK